MQPQGIVILEEEAILRVLSEQVGVAETDTIPLGILTTMLFPACMIEPAPSI